MDLNQRGRAIFLKVNDYNNKLLKNIFTRSSFKRLIPSPRVSELNNKNKR